jgi:hypothetical protein
VTYDRSISGLSQSQKPEFLFTIGIKGIVRMLVIRCFTLVLFLFFQTLNSYEFSKLTVLTGPIGLESSDEILGHYAVTRSLLRGLELSDVPFNYNPSSVDEVGDIIHVVAGDFDVLDQVLDLKNKGIVKRVMVGANNKALVSRKYAYMQNTEIVKRLLISDWVIHGHLLNTPTLTADVCAPWYSGVDETFFKPKKVNDYSSKKVLIYNKFQKDLTIEVSTVLEHYGWDPVVVSYGSYSIEEYRDLLNEVSFAIFLSASESQGIALAESWAMDVPTFCWNPKASVKYLGVIYPCSSSCPYLTPTVGCDWSSLEELEALLEKMNALLPNYYPRSWVLDNMTDKKSVDYLLQIIREIL